jgi:hypothetical protein
MQDAGNTMDLDNDNSMYDNGNDYWPPERPSGRSGAVNPNDEDTIPTVILHGRGPGRRAGHTATAVNRKMYVFGGSCGSDYCKFCWSLTVADLLGKFIISPFLIPSLS